jgi:hypothetical protein
MMFQVVIVYCRCIITSLHGHVNTHVSQNDFQSNSINDWYIIHKSKSFPYYKTSKQEKNWINRHTKFCLNRSTNQQSDAFFSLPWIRNQVTLYSKKNLSCIIFRYVLIVCRKWWIKRNAYLSLLLLLPIWILKNL